jgi:uncharacterized membrane protein
MGNRCAGLETMAAEQTEGDRRILWWLVIEVAVLLLLLLTLVTWSSSDYHYAIYAVFGISLIFAAIVLPATAVWWLSGESQEH